jgi:hypothetical protein
VGNQKRNFHIKTSLAMKKVFGIIALAIALGATMVSCTPHKQSCAAYSDIDLEAPVED